MSEIRLVRARGRVIKMKDLEIGEYAEIIESVRYEGYNFKGHIVVRTYDNFISITDPNHTWRNKPDIEVVVIPKGDRVEITV